jgi:hypothetical protein
VNSLGPKIRVLVTRYGKALEGAAQFGTQAVPHLLREVSRSRDQRGRQHGHGGPRVDRSGRLQRRPLRGEHVLETPFISVYYRQAMRNLIRPKLKIGGVSGQ